MDKTQRLFIAINFTAGTRAVLSGWRDELRAIASRGRFSSDENLHLTLAFLGECDDGQLELVQSVLAETEFEAFEISVGRLGRFRRRGGDIWWAAAEESIELMAVQLDLSSRLRAAGFALEDREFVPHITLGRNVRTTTEPWSVKPVSETVGQIDLMLSEHIEGRQIYTVLA
ncbi:MAG: RNA 2',3'-cyclic phosphodiesterase [Coriobacteriia bacterium]|nr:RNA 2',3'-cyclic phosphodiesterase [Coriobacteriia bacterium]